MRVSIQTNNFEKELLNIANYSLGFLEGAQKGKKVFLDNLGRGVDYPYLNTAQYPYSDINFRLIPEGINYNDNLTGYDFSFKPLIDNCE